MKRRLAGYRITEYAPGFFYLDLAYRNYSWRPWAPRIEWERLKNWDRGRYISGAFYVPDKVFTSVDSAEQEFALQQKYPRVVKEQKPSSLPSDYFTGPG